MAWKTVYDSVAGTSHADTGLPCQDACRIMQRLHDEGHLLAICCADGAGSATHSADGAQTVCDTFVRIVEREFENVAIDQDMCRDSAIAWCKELRSNVEARAHELDVEMRQLASTFLGAVIGESTALFVQIGDGAIVTLDGEEYRPIFWPQSGEFANTTNFLTDERFDDELEWQRLDERVDEVAVFSDGLERLILRFSEQAVHKPFLAPLFESLRNSSDPDEFFEPLRCFLESSRVNERTDDDKTLILATRICDCNNGDAIR